jgi:tryptophan synthase alpha subunit
MLRVATALGRDRNQGVGIAFYTVPGFPTEPVWAKTIEAVGAVRPAFYETGVTLREPSPDLGSDVARAVAHLVRAGVTPRRVANAHRHHRPSVAILHRAGELTEAEATSVLRDLRPGIDAVLPSGGDELSFELVVRMGFDVAVEVTPGMDMATLEKRARRSSAFLYLQCAPATGGPRYPVDSIAGAVERIRQVSDVPVCCGFGISTSRDVHELATTGCDAVIVGSALLSRMRAAAETERIDLVDAYVRSMAEAARRPPSSRPISAASSK